jgi:hypothetical protein
MKRLHLARNPHYFLLPTAALMLLFTVVLLLSDNDSPMGIPVPYTKVEIDWHLSSIFFVLAPLQGLIWTIYTFIPKFASNRYLLWIYVIPVLAMLLVLLCPLDLTTLPISFFEALEWAMILSIYPLMVIIYGQIFLLGILLVDSGRYVMNVYRGYGK